MNKFLVMVDDGVALSNIVEQATYMARSLGKFGADFSSLLVPIFHQRAMKLASDMWEDSISQFQHNFKKIEWIKIDFKSIMKSEKNKKLEKDDTIIRTGPIVFLPLNFASISLVGTLRKWHYKFFQ